MLSLEPVLAFGQCDAMGCSCACAGSIAFAMLPDGRSARAAGCGAAFLDGGCGYDLGTASWGVSRLVCVAWVRNRGWGRGGGCLLGWRLWL